MLSEVKDKKSHTRQTKQWKYKKSYTRQTKKYGNKTDSQKALVN